MKLLILLLWLGLIIGFSLMSRSCCEAPENFQADLTKRANDALATSPVGSNLKAEYNLLDGVITGTAPTKEAGQKIVNDLRLKVPEGELRNRIQTGPGSIAKAPAPKATVAQQPVVFDLDEQDTAVTLTGIVPTESIKQDSLKAAKDKRPNKQIIDKLTVADNTNKPTWAGRLPQFVSGYLDRTANAGINIDKGQNLRLRGDADSAPNIAGTGAWAKQYLGDGFELENQLKAATPAPAPAALAGPMHFLAQETPDGIVITGDVPAAGIKKLIGEQATAANPGVKVTNNLNVANVTPVNWSGRIPQLVRTHLASVDNGAVGLTKEGNVILRGEVADQAAKTERGDFATKLAPGSSVTNDLTVKAAAHAAVEPTEPLVFLAKETPGGIVINGEVPTDSLKQQISAKVQAAHPGVKVTNNLIVSNKVKGVPFGGGIPAMISSHLTSVEKGLIGLDREGVLTLLGEVPDRGAKKARGQAVAAVAGKGYKVTNGLTFPKPAPVAPAPVKPAPAQPTPAVAQKLVEDLALYPVFFATNVTAVEGKEIPKVKKAAEVIKKAGSGFKLECAGFADHRGNADYNKALSIKRATSVKNELIKLGVPANSITVKSYGDTKDGNSTNSDGALRNERRVEIKVIN